MRRTIASLLLAGLILASFASPALAADAKDIVASDLPRAADAKNIVVSNFTNGETVRYPVPLLKGTLSDTKATSISIINETAKIPGQTTTGLALNGRFKALTELVPGENKLVLQSGDTKLPFTLIYKPQTNPNIVRAVFVTDNTGNTAYDTPDPKDAQDYKGKFDTSLKLMQSFTAEWMNDQGYGRKTFNLETDKDGRVIVHIVKGDKPAAEYFKPDRGELFDMLNKVMNEQSPNPLAKNLVLIAFSRFDPVQKKNLAYTALGGGNQALFGGSCMYTWPDTIAQAQPAFMDGTLIDETAHGSDSADRHAYWANSSTGIGAALHELSHTFGLPHTTDARDIMTRGIDRFNRFFTFIDPACKRVKQAVEFTPEQEAYFCPVSAASLAPSPFFRIDAQVRSTFKADPAASTIVIQNPKGIAFVGVETAGAADAFLPIDQSKPLATEIKVPYTLMLEKVKGDTIALRVINGQGDATSARYLRTSLTPGSDAKPVEGRRGRRSTTNPATNPASSSSATTTTNTTADPAANAK